MRNHHTFIHEVYNFSGTPYEIGHQRGKLMAEPIKKALKKLVFGNPYSDVRPKPEQYTLAHFREHFPDQLKRWEKALDTLPDWFTEEVRGNADGAGVPYEKLILATDWFPFLLKGGSEAGEGAPPTDDCSGFMAHGGATADGSPLVGGNSESSHPSIKTLSVIRLKNKIGNSFVMQAHIPWLCGGQAGMNEKGVCIFGSGVSIKPEVFGDIGHRRGVRRRILQDANNLDEAIDILKEAPRMGGQHIYLADPKRAVHCEYTSKRVEVIDPESGFDAGSSPYFSSPKMKPSCNVYVDETVPGFSYHLAKKRGVFRMEQYHALFKAKKPLTLEKIPSILGNHGGRGTGIIRESIEGAIPQGSDYTICVHGGSAHGGGGPAGETGSFHSSGWSNISVPSKLKFYMAFGSPCEAGFIPFKPPTS